MKKKQENKNQMFNPSIAFISHNDPLQIQSKIAFSRSKTPFFRKKNNYNSEEENISSNTLNKSINNQTFIYNSINFNNQGLFNNINNLNNTNLKKRKSANNYMVNAGIINFFGTMKKSRSISKQKKGKYINIINKLNNTPFFSKTMNKHKSNSFAKQKNNSFKNDKKKSNLISITRINTSPSYLNNTNNFSRKNKRKLMTTNYNINKNSNMLNVLNNNKINNLILTNNSNNSKVKKMKKNTDIINKNIDLNIQKSQSDRNNMKKQESSVENTSITEEDKNILLRIESLILQLLNNYSSPKNLILKEIERIFRNCLKWYDDNNGNQISKNFNSNLSKKNIKGIESKQKEVNNNNIINCNKISDVGKIDKSNIMIENELNSLNKKYNQIKEENINLKYLITEKTTAFEDVKNSLKNFQNEINLLKLNNNQNSIKNKNNDNQAENDNNIIFVNSKGLEMKNVKINISNIKKVNEIQDISSLKNKPKESNKDSNNSFDCNNYSFGQNNSLDFHFENSNNNSKNNIFNSNNSIDPLSLTFHEQMSIIEENQQNDLGQDLNKNYDGSPSLRKATEILIQTGTMPIKDEKNK
jgi:hypothetical protein